MTSEPAISLSDNYRRGIVSALLLFDRMLCEAEEYAQGREARSVFYVEQNALSPDQRENLLAQVTEMRGLLQGIKDGLGLKVETEDVARKIWGQGSTFWEVLVGTKTRFLRRYGQPTEGLAEYLDPRIDLLIEHLRNLTDLVQPGGRPLEEHDS
jgi:hypothetical protein